MEMGAGKKAHDSLGYMVQSIGLAVRHVVQPIGPAVTVDQSIDALDQVIDIDNGECACGISPVESDSIAGQPDIDQEFTRTSAVATTLPSCNISLRPSTCSGESETVLR